MLKPKQNMMTHPPTSQSIHNYRKLNLQGKGNYGQVYMAQNKHTNATVAIKKVQKKVEDLQGLSVTFLRQISILRKLNHPNIVKLLDFCVDAHQINAYLILEFVGSDLAREVEIGRIGEQRMRNILRQIMEAIAYCHKNNIIHRDIKPSNILINTQTDQIKVADFGIAKPVLLNPRCNTFKVAALYYRAPESLLEDETSTFSIDMWGIGCLFAQCILGKVLFRSQFVAEISQLSQIIKVLQIDFKQPLFNYSFKDLRTKFKGIHQQPIEKKIPQLNQLLSASGLDLLNKMLSFDPNNRIKAEQALKHDFFRVNKYAQHNDSQMDIQQNFPRL